MPHQRLRDRHPTQQTSAKLGIERSTMPARHRRPRKLPPERIGTFELLITATVVVLVVGVLAVFLFIYHDLPFRIGGP
jgi:hypothetical protein